MRKHHPLRQKIINSIIEAREEKGLSKRALSRKLGEHVTYIYEIEAGQHAVRTEEFIEIALALEVDPRDLLDRVLRRRG